MLELTSEHMVPVFTRDGKTEVLMAGHVRLGDALTVVGKGLQPVLAIGTTTKAGGAYAPFTRAGTVAVNGVVASCYCGDFYGNSILSAQAVAKLALAPLAAAHAILDASAAQTALEKYGVGKKGIHPYVAGLMTLGDLLKRAAAAGH